MNTAHAAAETEVEEQEREAKEALLADLKTKHGRIYELEREVDGEHVLFVFKAPDGLTWKAFEKAVEAGESYEASNNLVAKLVVHPSSEKLAKLLSDFPSLKNPITSEISRVARGERTQAAKKV